MNKGIELRLNYIGLIREGKTSEAWIVLNQIWSLDKPKQSKDTRLVETIKQIEVVDKDENFLQWLIDVDGIGPKTANKLFKDYPSKKILRDTLDNNIKELIDKYRDDIVHKLNKELKI